MSGGLGGFCGGHGQLVPLLGDGGVAQQCVAGGAEAQGVGEDGGQKFWRMEFVRRKASGLEYTLEQSTTLLEAFFAPVDLGPANVADIDDFWERVRLEVDYDEATEPKGFLRARVRVP